MIETKWRAVSSRRQHRAAREINAETDYVRWFEFGLAYRGPNSRCSTLDPIGWMLQGELRGQALVRARQAIDDLAVTIAGGGLRQLAAAQVDHHSADAFRAKIES